jgi:glycine/serine hydroxymethyltransferase
MIQVAAWLDRIMGSKGAAAETATVRAEIRAFCTRFPMPH